MITDNMKNIIANKIANELIKQNNIKRGLIYQSKNALMINTLLCLLVSGIHLSTKCLYGNHAFMSSMFIGIFYEIPVVFIILIMITRGKSSSIQKVRLPIECIICNVLSITEACIVFTWIPYYFTYDFTTDTSRITFWKLLIVAPVLFIIMVIWSISCNYNYEVQTYNSYYNYDKTLYHTIMDSGIHPNDIPYNIYTDKYVKQLTTQDWRDIGNFVLDYGINLFMY